MPIYEYVCEACGTLTELMQKVSDPPLKKCPECGSKKVAKLVSRTSFQLRGGGWYADLYSSPQKDAKKDEAAAGVTPAATPAPAAAPAPAAPPAEAAKPAPKAARPGKSGKRPARKTG